MTSTETGFSSARFVITFFPAERGNSSPGGNGVYRHERYCGPSRSPVTPWAWRGCSSAAGEWMGVSFQRKRFDRLEEEWGGEVGCGARHHPVRKRRQQYGYLTTEKNYRDFNLRLKFKGEAAGNSGVFFHARITGIDPGYGPDIEGMQVEVDPDAGKHTGGLYESGGRGWVKMPTAEGEQAPQRREDRGLHRPGAEIQRWRDWVADSHRRRRENEMERHFYSGK